MTTTVFKVIGMSCGSCASSVSAAVGELPQVRKIRVDLVSGEVTVVSDEAVADSAMRAAIESAGYTVDPV